MPNLPTELAAQKCQSRSVGASFVKHVSRKTSFHPCSNSDKQGMDWYPLIKSSITYPIGQVVLVSKSHSGRRSACHALLEGSDQLDAAFDMQSQERHVSSESESLTESVTKESHTVSELHANVKSNYSGRNQGKSGIVSFYSAGQHGLAQPKIGQEIQASSDAWVSLLWILGPVALVSSVVLPPFLLRKLFEVVLEDSLVTDFLILFFTETLFYVGVSVFLVVAHKVQQSTGVVTWNSGSRVSLGYKLSSYATMVLAVLLPIGAFAIVWPWTGPAAAAALFPYIAGLAVQYGFEQVVQERKSSVWPLIPIVFQVYRLHQLNRATQLVAGLLYSLRGAEATAETLAVNGSLRTLVIVLQLLGILCLWSLTAYLTHVFSSESQDWQSRVLS